MDMEELFDKIFQHFITKREYFEIFSHKDHLSAMEDWFRGEIVWLMHQSPLKEQQIFINTCRSKKPGTGGGNEKCENARSEIDYAGIAHYIRLCMIVKEARLWHLVQDSVVPSEILSSWGKQVKPNVHGDLCVFVCKRQSDRIVA